MGSVSYFDPRPPTFAGPSDQARDFLVRAQDFQPPQGSPGWAPGSKFLLFVATTLRLSDTRTPLEFNELGIMRPYDMPLQYVLELSSRYEVLGGE